MAPIKIVQVISFSNEDPKHPAENLLKDDSYQKWKCIATNKEKQIHVILKLECLTKISSIDIGNESSAFVEVLAGREGVDYKVLLPASSYMTPLEARNNIQTNRVRLFPIEKLTKSTAEEKWDRIKIICTQPFNKALQYGISFVRLHSMEKTESATGSRHSLGSFILTDPNNDSDDIKVGSLFKSRTDSSSKKTDENDKVKNEPSTKLAVTVKEESCNAPDVGFYQPKKEEKPIKRILEKDASTSHHNIGTPQYKKRKKEDKEIITEKHRENDISKSKLIETNSQTKDNEVQKIHRPFNQLFNDVVFVMSGYQNPERSNLRDKMIELGAKYKSDWDKKCTHLLCAFRNTPKYRAIKGKGIIVSEKWTEDCYKQKKKLSPTRYFLEKNSAPSIVNEEEIWADEIMPKNACDSSSKKDLVSEPVVDLSDYEAETEDEDTDDEIRRVIANQNDSTKSADAKIELSKDSYDEDTEIDEENKKKDTSQLELPPLPDFFNNKYFFLYGSFSEDKTKLIERYIIGFNGKIEYYMTKDVNYVITENQWDEHFEDALCDNATLQFVRPQWIWRCSEKQKFVPPQPYIVVPKDIQ